MNNWCQADVCNSVSYIIYVVVGCVFLLPTQVLKFRSLDLVQGASLLGMAS